MKRVEGDDQRTLTAQLQRLELLKQSSVKPSFVFLSTPVDFLLGQVKLSVRK